MESSYSKPWMQPILKEHMKLFLYENGKDYIYKKGATIVKEKEYLQDILLVKSGITSNSVVCCDVNKPLLTYGIRLAGQMSGYDTFLQREYVPSRIVALDHVNVLRVSFSKIDWYLDRHPDLKIDFYRHCLKSLDSDSRALLAMTITNTEERFLILVASIFSTLGVIPKDGSEWVERPFKLFRQNLSNLLYVSTITVDRLYANMIKTGKLRRNRIGNYEVHISAIEEGMRLMDALCSAHSLRRTSFV